MKKYLLLWYLVLTSFLSAQLDISGGMGLNFFSAPDLRDYINSYSTAVNEVASFSTSADFFGEVGYNLNNKYQIALEYTFNIYSFNSPGANGTYDYSIDQHKPSLITYYVINGEGYKFKFGAGLGFRMGQISEKLSGYVQTQDYSVNGFGGLLKIQGDTKLGDNFYAVIAGEMRYESYEEITVISNNNKFSYNIDSFGVALKLGVAYYL